MKTFNWRYIPVLLFLILALFLWRGLSLDPHQLPSEQLGKALPAFNVAQLQNASKSFSSEELKHRVSLLNVWSSWCDSCQQEQVVLMQLASVGVPIYGLNYKDTTEEARHWLELWGNPYRNIGQDPAGRLAIDLGVYGVPETFVIDKKGIIRYRQAGIISQEFWLNTLQPLMKKLEQEA